jgi:stage III sporulation protein AE
MPCVSAYAALSAADAAVGNDVLKNAKKLLKKVCETLLAVICTAFTFWLGLSGVAADPADAVASRAAKTAISTALPVVGGILSDAAGSLAAAAAVLRGSIGIYGMLATAFICMGPAAALGTRYLAYKLSAAICCTVSEKRLEKLVEDLGTCFGLILAVNGAGALMLFISIYSLIRTAF